MSEQVSELVETCYGTKPAEDRIIHVDREVVVTQEKAVRADPEYGPVGFVLLLVAVIGCICGMFIGYYTKGDDEPEQAEAEVAETTDEYDDSACGALGKEYSDYFVNIHSFNVDAVRHPVHGCTLEVKPERRKKYTLTGKYIEAYLAMKVEAAKFPQPEEKEHDSSRY